MIMRSIAGAAMTTSMRDMITDLILIAMATGSIAGAAMTIRMWNMTTNLTLIAMVTESIAGAATITAMKAAGMSR